MRATATAAIATAGATSSFGAKRRCWRLLRAAADAGALTLQLLLVQLHMRADCCSVAKHLAGLAAEALAGRWLLCVAAVVK
jgi:hypothetical protein